MFKEIKMSNGRTIIVDDEDFEHLNQFKWCAFGNHIGRYSKERKLVYMHRYLMNTPKEMVCDHINGNPLDNRKSNLRNCTQSQNCMNRRKISGLKGTYWRKEKNRWIAHIVICIDGAKKQIRLGSYKTQEEAARVYDEAAIKYYGEFARLNYGDYL